jgi:glucose/arabinose dehydrogenase
MPGKTSIALGAALALALAGAAAAQTLPPPPPPLPPWVPPPAGKPVEYEPPNAKTQTPAFPGQTRGPYEPTHVAYEVKTIADGLEHPWGLAFLPDGRMLVTERPGRLRIVAPDGKVSTPVAGLPQVDGREGGGLMDVEVDPDFATNHLIYWAYAEPRGDGAGTTVARARLVFTPGDQDLVKVFALPASDSMVATSLAGGAHVEDIQTIFRTSPTVDTTRSFGSRIVFGAGQSLFITIGDFDFDPYRPLVQRLDTDVGKVVRINRDGSIPKDNPYLNVKGALPELWAVGFRNPLGAAIDPKTGDLWTNENGPRGGDELNHVRAGKNYGWPLITYGEEYSGQHVGEGKTQAPGMEQPVYFWDPVIAPSGMEFYTGALFPAWKGSLFLGSMRQKHLVRLSIKDDRVTGEERLMTETGYRIRGVRQGPDGALYVITEEARGKLLKLVPKGQ